jgi:hypothetical protein
MTLIEQVKELMKEGVFNPEDLFKILYQKNRVHYSRVREAIHVAKNKGV